MPGSHRWQVQSNCSYSLLAPSHAPEKRTSSVEGRLTLGKFWLALEFRWMDEKENGKSAAAASDGASRATSGPLEIAGQGAATALSAGLVIVLGAAAGGILSFLGYKLHYHFTKRKS